MAVKLTHFEDVNGESLSIVVKYDIKEFEVEDIEAVYIRSERKECEITDVNPFSATVSVWDIFKEIPEMEVAIEKIVARVDWRELYAETVNQ